MATRTPLFLAVRALVSVLDGTDPFTQGRSLRIARCALELGVPESEWQTIELGALLHDVGRNAILGEVLQHPGALDSGARAMVQTHASAGWELLRDIPGLEAAAEIVHTHHEQPNGGGYPRRLDAERIPLGARIVMVCAAFDAMTEDRPYRRGLQHETALGELRRHSGTQFFPDVVAAFVALAESGRLWDGAPPEEREEYLQRRGRTAA